MYYVTKTWRRLILNIHTLDLQDLLLAGVPDRLLRWLVSFIAAESLGDSTAWSWAKLVMLPEEAAWLANPAACMAEAETGGVADLELVLLELSPQLFSSMTRAGDFMSILGRAEENFLLVNSISRACDGGKFDPPPTASFLSASRNSARFLCNSSSVDSYRRWSFFSWSVI